MTIQRFEDLDCWKSARDLVREVFILTNEPLFDRFRDLRWQLQNAALSIMNNIAEGFDRFYLKERMLFLNYATGSAGEVRSMLYTCLDLQLITEMQFRELKGRAQSTQRQTAGLIRYLRKISS